jgi:capsular polysaccharide transport system permease protein
MQMKPWLTPRFAATGNDVQRSRLGGAPFPDLLLASLLRDMRTRFGRSYLSYILAIAWPLTHLATMFGAYLFTHKVAPIGDDPSVFAFTGLVPYIMCLYPARFTSWTILQNKPLLNFPVVKPIHLITARAILESLTALISLAVFVSVLTVFNLATPPDDAYIFAETIGGIIFFSVSYGFFGILLVALQPNFGTVFIIISIVILYLTSGAIVPLTLAPPNIQNLLSYNPLFEAVGLMRSAYFSAYDVSNYSLAYIYFVGIVFLLLGLISDRLFRGVII